MRRPVAKLSTHPYGFSFHKDKAIVKEKEHRGNGAEKR